MINIYLKIIKQLKDEISSLIDEFENEEVVFNDESLGFKFKTDDNLVYDEKINIPVCVISISSVIKEKYIHYLILKLQKCFYEIFS